MTPSDYVVCAVCGDRFARIQHTHLKKHSLTFTQYRDMYPDSPLICEKLKKAADSQSLQHFIRKYGDVEGQLKYEENRTFLAHKNSFEYKQAHKGWTKQQYDEYNKSRRHTLETSIQRHGETVGTQKWHDYVELQRTAGVTLEWFQTKYGAEHGKQVYADVSRKKSHSLGAYQDRYGLDGYRKFAEFHEKRAQQSTKYTSGMERDFAALVCDVLGECYSVLTKQFASWNTTEHRLFMYDIVSTQRKVCVEFNGDYWHCNPRTFGAEYLHPHRKITAADIWNADRKKLEHIAGRGYLVKVVWECDWKTNKERILQEIRELCQT